MADPNLDDFRRRVGRISRAHGKGRGFEAAGTVGRGRRWQPRLRHRVFLRMTLFVVVCGFGLKGFLLQSAGPDAYAARLERLQSGQGVDLLGAWLMQADPVTGWVAAQIAVLRSILEV